MTEAESMHERSGKVHDNRPLVGFLYDILKEAEVGRIEEIVQAQGSIGARFTNGWLAKYAIDIADRLSPPVKPQERCYHHRPEGTAQCIKSFEMHEKGEKHWPCCALEKDHEGKCRHWLTVDFVPDEIMTLNAGGPEHDTVRMRTEQLLYELMNAHFDSRDSDIGLAMQRLMIVLQPKDHGRGPGGA